MTDRPPITHVAVRFRGVVYSLPCPNRHYDVIRLIAEQTGASYVDARDDDQGFLAASGRYLRRAQALVSAQINGQIKEGSNVPRQLYSEDVW